MKVKTMRLHVLRNEEHFQFMIDFKGLVEAAGASVLNIEQEFAVFKDVLEKEDLGLEIVRRNKLTDSITDIDARRGSAYRGFSLLVKTFSHSVNVDKANAAHNLQVILDHYGDIRKKSYNEKTATIYNFLQEMNDHSASEIALLDAREWIAELTAANEEFNNLLNQRFDNKAEQEHINMYETRKVIDTIYTKAIDRVNASILLNGEANYVTFVNKLNERIDYFKNTILQRKGRKEAKKEKEKMNE